MLTKTKDGDKTTNLDLISRQVTQFYILIRLLLIMLDKKFIYVDLIYFYSNSIYFIKYLIQFKFILLNFICFIKRILDSESSFWKTSHMFKKNLIFLWCILDFPKTMFQIFWKASSIVEEVIKKSLSQKIKHYFRNDRGWN